MFLKWVNISKEVLCPLQCCSWGVVVSYTNFLQLKLFSRDYNFSQQNYWSKINTFKSTKTLHYIKYPLQKSWKIFPQINYRVMQLKTNIFISVTKTFHSTRFYLKMIFYYTEKKTPAKIGIKNVLYSIFIHFFPSHCI